VIYKKHFKEETFKNKIFEDRECRLVSHQNLNLLNQMDSNSEGLVAIAEGQSLVFYSASQFFEDGVLSAYDLSQDLYKGDKKEGNPALSVVDTHKVTFRPLCVKFNRAN